MVQEPHIEVEFPLIDGDYRVGMTLTDRDEELLALMFNKIVQGAIKAMQEASVGPRTLTQTQQVLAGEEDGEPA
jgi:hypothetical protein